jgi:hypothetical protein
MPSNDGGWDDFFASMPGSQPHEFEGENACEAALGDHECYVIGCGRTFSHPIHRV